LAFVDIATDHYSFSNLIVITTQMVLRCYPSREFT
jgi:hypothetical protein